MSKIAFPLIALTLLTSQAAFADDASTSLGSNNYYVRIDGGSTLSNHIGKGYGSDAYPYTMKTKKNIGIVSGGVGAYLGSNFRADITYTGHSALKRTVTHSFPNGMTGVVNYKVTSNVGLLTGYYDLGNFANFVPYLSAGAGWSSNRSHAASFAYTGGANNATGYIAKKTTNNFAYALGLGTSYAFNPSVAVDVAYRFTNLGRVKTGNVIVVNGVTDNYDTPGKGRIYNHAILGGLRFSF